MKKVLENQNNHNNHYLYPFFWQHGESQEKIEEYIDQIHGQGIHNLCIESRPHPDFLGPGWWKTMDTIITKAKGYGMKLWVLDDAKFPTGYANGQVPESLKKKYLGVRRYDLAGPNRYGQLDLRILVDMREYGKDQRHQSDQFYKAFIARNDLSNKDAFDESSIVDITKGYHDGYLNFELGNDHYSVFVLYKTGCGQEEATSNYLDPTLKEATDILITEVYQKHYDHFKDEFGQTIVGFFSDEPRFGNVKGPNAIIGQTLMPLPFNDLIEKKLTSLLENKISDLVYLFYGNSQAASVMRFNYMNLVSKLYQENFSEHLGNWCRDHQVEYLGHVIEDNNAHARLGYGPGHFFRAMAGQDMAGIDIIGGQVVPGMDYYHESFSTGGSDGEFYHYALVNLGASAAKLDSKKQGRLMCEAYGAYGWIEGLKMMKWISDHMISHGVNVIVPHAFNPKKFPDWDCPPHFYAHGKNPQYPYFHHLTAYLDRLCHLFSGGHKMARVGVLYHGFGEWGGEAMPVQKVIKNLQQYQISCDVISEDYLMEAKADADLNCFKINKYDYEVLIVPYAQRLPQLLLKKIAELSSVVQVVFVDEFPEGYRNLNAKVIPLEKLAVHLDSHQDVKLLSPEPSLVCYKYQQEDGRCYFLTNESVNKTVNTVIALNEAKEFATYDAFSNQVYELEGRLSATEYVFELNLAPFQSLVLVEMAGTKTKPQKGKLVQVVDKAKISLKNFDQASYEVISTTKITDYLGRQYPDFSGSIMYEIELNIEYPDLMIEIEEAYETITVLVNDQEVASLIAPPYVIDLSGYMQVGVNQLTIIVTNTLYRHQRDAFSTYFACEPLGIISPIKLYERIQNSPNQNFDKG